MLDKPLTKMLVKPVGSDCNMNRPYCFYDKKTELLSKQRSLRMSENLLQRIIVQLMEQDIPQVSISWQGG